jgi:drug/metabolite transporter (DMT)-like permease
MLTFTKNSILRIRQKGTRFKALFALSLVSVIWGTTWVAAKLGVNHMPALQLAGIRQVLAGSVYVGFFLFRGFPLPKGKEWWTVIILSILNFLLSNGLGTWGVKYVSAGLAAIIGAIFPLWLVIIGFFDAKAKIPVKAIIGLILGFTGICVIFVDHLYDFMNADFRFGILLSLIATISWAFGILFTKAKAHHFNPYFSVGLQMLISGVALYALAIGLGQTVPVTAIPWQSWVAIFYLVSISSVITFAAYLYALQNLPTGLVSIYAYINPIVAVICAWLLFDEKISIYIVAGGGIALCGVYLVNETFREKKVL